VTDLHAHGRSPSREGWGRGEGLVRLVQKKFSNWASTST